MNMITRVLIFLLINFGALGLGSLFTSNGVSSEWYLSLDKAPWTPPGWMFGLAWTTIMICFSLYMANLWSLEKNKGLLIFLFAVQWVLNVAWNPAFFHYQQVNFALVIIVLLTILVGYFLLHYKSILHLKSLYILPYFVWLLIASSLNLYIVLRN